MRPKAYTSRTLRAAYRALKQGAPPGEKRDALLEAAREVAPLAKAIPVSEVIRYAQMFADHSKPATPVIQRMAKVVLNPGDGPKGEVWLARPTGLDFPQLRLIAREDPVIQAIIWTRIAQVRRFLRPSNQEWKPGFRIRYRDRNRRITDADTRRLQWLEQFVLNCGAEFDPRKRRMLRRDSLWDWAAKHLQDSLSLDAAPIELIPTPSGRTHGWVHVDGGRVYLTDPNYGATAHPEPPTIETVYGLDIPDPEEVIGVLVDEGKVLAWYTHMDLLYRVRRPSSDMSRLGYGQPEVEDLIKIVTGFLNALTLNLRGFTHNSIPRGILLISGDFTQQDIEQMRYEWDAWLSGVQGRWRLPLLISESSSPATATFVPIGTDFNEMYFSKWMTFLVAVKAALFGMDPEEINFEAFTHKPSTLSGSDTEERLASSKDKGLWPLLAFLEQTLNEILQTVDPEVELYWTGLELDQQMTKKDEQIMLTLGEFRARRGETIPEDPVLANAPLNPSLMGLYQMRLQQQMQAAEQALQNLMAGNGEGPPTLHDAEGNQWQAHHPEGEKQETQEKEAQEEGKEEREQGEEKPSAKPEVEEWPID